MLGKGQIDLHLYTKHQSPTHSQALALASMLKLTEMLGVALGDSPFSPFLPFQ